MPVSVSVDAPATHKHRKLSLALREREDITMSERFEAVKEIHLSDYASGPGV